MRKGARKEHIPDGWLDSTDEQKKEWATQAESMRTECRVVPPDSLQSFAVVWQYVQKKATERRKPDGSLKKNQDEYVADEEEEAESAA